ncbi:MAG: NTP transferase domain-containing protein, partial [Pyrinomonadaceae bacterium]|nr:NTP transferase domain-containing protein [Pyrinomonadaceae bacterium]
MTENSNGKIGGLILAAGGSSRLGRPKQLVHFQGKTLIRNAAETLVDSSCDSIVVVLGAEIDGSTSEIADLPINI